jgi:hypothetical protein
MSSFLPVPTDDINQCSKSKATALEYDSQATRRLGLPNAQIWRRDLLASFIALPILAQFAACNSAMISAQCSSM